MSRDNLGYTDSGMQLRAEKARIRREMMGLRRNLTEADALEKGRRILDLLKSLPEYRKARLVHTFVSMPGEIDTRGLVEDAFSNGIRVAVPVVRKGERDLLHSEIKGLSDLRPEGTWGILQPPAEGIRPVSPAEVDMVIVPGLAFDTSGNRIGFGAGYYDRFLRKVMSPKVAIAYDFQVLDKVPVTEEDVPVDQIVTEEGVCVCRGQQGYTP